MRQGRPKGLDEILHRVSTLKTLEPEQKQAIAKAAKALGHALSVRDHKTVEKAINMIARQLVKSGLK